MITDPRLALDLAGVKMQNPLIAASGCYGFGFDYIQWVDPREWGAIALKGITLEPRAGNPRRAWRKRRRGCSTPLACKIPASPSF